MRGYNRVFMLGGYRRALVWPSVGLVFAVVTLAILAISAEPAVAAAASQGQSNSEPTFAGVGNLVLTVAENSRAGANIGQPLPEATDLDNDTLDYTLAGTDMDSFDFDGTSRQISVAAVTNLDYERKDAYSVRLQVKDNKNAKAIPMMLSTLPLPLLST